MKKAYEAKIDELTNISQIKLTNYHISSALAMLRSIKSTNEKVDSYAGVIEEKINLIKAELEFLKI